MSTAAAAPSSPSFRPLYRQIKSLITQSLISAEWRPGEAIPSEIELAARYRVSQGTVRKAISELADENVLIRHQGKGTFVASHNEAQRKFHFVRVLLDNSASGGAPVFPVGELLDCRRGKADAQLARALEITHGAAVMVINRLQRIAGEPVMLEEIRLPAGLVKGLAAEMVERNQCKIYSLLESEYDVLITHVVEQIKATTAGTRSAKLLGVVPGAPLLAIERVAYTYDDKPVEWRKTLCNTARHFYSNKII
ncbi:MAG: GntR family transcriptional regulator [Burkholderiales bacterium]|nr:GntR family transcriptional regulator [Pseudomonadota bacterium]